jgi:hypothetical protein
MQRPLLLAVLACWPLRLPPTAQAQEAPPLRAGLIGLDTSHVVAFTERPCRAVKMPETLGRRAAGAAGGALRLPPSCSR